MSTLIKISLDLSKIETEKVIEGKKGNYVDLTISVNDEVNDYNQNVTVYHSQSKEEREAKENRIFVGNGRVIYHDGDVTVVPFEKNEEPKPKAKNPFKKK